MFLCYFGLLLCFVWRTSALRSKTCQELLPNSFTRDQRNHFCKNSLGVPSTHCASEAKSVLRLKYDDIFALCQYSTSPTTVDCLQELSLKDRSAVGAKLCAAATSTMSAICYKTVSQIKTVKQLDPNDIITFCSDMEDTSPISCLTSALSHRIPALAALEHCPYVVDADITSSCLSTLSSHISPSRGVSADAIIAFCSSQSTTNATDCYLNPISTSLTPTQKLTLCSSATSTTGPTSCLSKILPNLPIADAITLCQTAINTGPALCFNNLPPTTATTTKIQLCSGSAGIGPSQCYRRGSSSNMDDETKVMLCSSSSSDGPMSCYLAAPLSLAAGDKLLLCQDSIPARYKDPVDCFNHVTSFAKKFKDGPRKSLSSPNLNPSEALTKQLLLTLCSATTSMLPLYGAQCLQNTPTTIPLNDAIVACYNSTGETEVVAGLCESLLPKKYPSILCAGEISREIVVSRIACVSSMTDMKYNMTVATTICVENPASADCIATSGLRNDELIMSVCRSITTSTPTESTAMTANAVGECLKQLLSSKLQYQADALMLLCSSPPTTALLPCLRSLNRRTVLTTADATTCLTVVPVITTIKIAKLVGIHNSPFATATKPFSLYIELYDQFNNPIGSKAVASTRVRISIASNEQGAVLWGQSYNSTATNALELHNLAISQPGVVALKIIVEENGVQAAVYVTQMLVQPDTTTPPTTHCLFLFSAAVCDASNPTTGANVWLEGVVPTRHLLPLLSCTDVFNTWAVSVEYSYSGLIVTNYRSGIDSIWTGVGLPQSDQDYYTRLDVTSSSTVKEIRRAYYKKSLMWHPDRWAGLGFYSQVVTGAFELIAEAYKGLTESDESKE